MSKHGGFCFSGCVQLWVDHPHKTVIQRIAQGKIEAANNIIFLLYYVSGGFYYA